MAITFSRQSHARTLLSIVCYTTVFSVVTQRWEERCVTTLKPAVSQTYNNGCVADYTWYWENLVLVVVRVLESTSLCYYTPLATLHNYPIISTHLKGISHVSKWNNILFVIINQQCWLSRVKCTVSTVFMKRVQPSLKYKMITQVTHFNDYLSFGLLNYRREK